MRHFSFDNLTLARLDPIRLEVIGGSRPRLTLEHKTNKQRFFLKSYRHNPREVWAEMFASQLGKETGIKIQAVSLKKIPSDLAHIFRSNYKDYLPEDWHPVGALVRNVFPKNHELLYGAQIIGTASDPVTLEQVEADIRSRYLDSEDLLQDFSDMIVFDAWIGNMDRHHENWAIYQKNVVVQFSLFTLTKEQREMIKRMRGFTPLFDHGSSLLFELDEKQVAYFLGHLDRFTESYILGKKYALILGSDGEQLNIYEVIARQLKTSGKWAKRFRKSIQKIAAVNSLTVARLILEMPTGGELDYGQDRKNLLYYSLEKRREILKEYISL